jgi:Spx/MgsR family transcriptional regulator
MSSMELYGIPNCDTVKKARAWLAAHAIEARFHDVRKDGLPQALPHWIEVLGWETLLNRAGTSFRALPDSEKAGLDAARAQALIAANPAMMKRPVLAGTGPAGTPVLLVGFRPEVWAATLQP